MALSAPKSGGSCGVVGAATSGSGDSLFTGGGGAEAAEGRVEDEGSAAPVTGDCSVLPDGGAMGSAVAVTVKAAGATGGPMTCAGAGITGAELKGGAGTGSAVGGVGS